jgi:hypothetical protein
LAGIRGDHSYLFRACPDEARRLMDEMRTEKMEKEEGYYIEANYWQEIDRLTPRL